VRSEKCEWLVGRGLTRACVGWSSAFPGACLGWGREVRSEECEWRVGRVGVVERAAELFGVGDGSVPSPLACSEVAGGDWVAGGGLIVGSAA
jgi:hypothetical protein